MQINNIVNYLGKKVVSNVIVDSFVAEGEIGKVTHIGIDDIGNPEIAVCFNSALDSTYFFVGQEIGVMVTVD